jgi:hypothetical protein
MAVRSGGKDADQDTVLAALPDGADLGEARGA